ncbi:adhesion G protein-coupled receptor E5-like [Chrysemys picta bellii]|uniref:adhesion G protein-coupled receptor E5-like n=1 Tax=Chrysemys picta bellii TaxID=8478 RepID=UPI0032B1F4BA
MHQVFLCPQENKTDLRLLCAYWKPDSRRWATHSCTLQKLNATITRCQCNHLTSVAVLMAFYELEDWTLDVITQEGLVISLLCLLLSIVTFLFCRALKGPRTTIHLHLCLALFIAYTVFLTGTSSTGNRVPGPPASLGPHSPQRPLLGAPPTASLGPQVL